MITRLSRIKGNTVTHQGVSCPLIRKDEELQPREPSSECFRCCVACLPSRRTCSLNGNFHYQAIPPEPSPVLGCIPRHLPEVLPTYCSDFVVQPGCLNLLSIHCSTPGAINYKPSPPSRAPRTVPFGSDCQASLSCGLYVLKFTPESRTLNNIIKEPDVWVWAELIV
jgi:hypothetical protein